MNLFHKIFGHKANISKQDLQDYLQHKASLETQRRVEAKMTDSPLLADAMDGFMEQGSQNLSEVPDFREFQSRRKLGKVRRMAPYINRVAALLLGAMAVSGLYYYWEETTTDRMYAAYFDEFQDPSVSGMRSGESEEQWHPAKAEAVWHYGAGDYESSIIYWEKYQDAFPDSLQAPMFIGYCHLKLGRSQQAISHLEPLTNINNPYKEEAQWYLALAYLHQRKTDLARPILENLQDKAHDYYASKAQKILERL